MPGVNLLSRINQTPWQRHVSALVTLKDPGVHIIPGHLGVQLALFTEDELLNGGPLMTNTTRVPIHPIARLWLRRCRAIERGDMDSARSFMNAIDGLLDAQLHKENQ